MTHVMYVLECKDGSWYTGYTNHLQKRLAMHEAGKGAKYTRGRGPFTLVFFEEFPTKEEAMRCEYAFKQLSKKEKQLYIAMRRKEEGR
ncbi:MULTISPECIES: GIY-YIG nuclease family protein [Shouchella]|jgi:putative endonuclease|uniref:GIY-YIG domain-containing protein n=3 Tax=Shouchella TaxID=2893057 RepID=Q5WLX6_SHOC1|nr:MULTISPECIES: GIY-YIG nuclease family protein [Shouchella]MCM3314727.1 GIY-YIG nuclease family protein [Psychrobacillus sp. MER TA 17]PAD42376.1 endonuclease [Bacillus sp. 7520-S]KKI85802.1 endonuclease [Shouchella clausii]MBX0321012.1 GIY-YIG nuclease family protein [Shouchella clausii]MCM3382001.1 GIY-YIG nuclease family protein [Shouchella rhizosphaerae]